jgi:hypothetical protein
MRSVAEHLKKRLLTKQTPRLDLTHSMGRLCSDCAKDKRAQMDNLTTNITDFGKQSRKLVLSNGSDRDTVTKRNFLFL